MLCTFLVGEATGELGETRNMLFGEIPVSSTSSIPDSVP
jgi:hypothetical protein